MAVSFKITGGPETARALQLLGRRSTEEKALRQALRPGATATVQAARAAAPVETGALRRSIVVGILKAPHPRAARLAVAHRKDDPQQRWRISHIIEFGSRYMSARPYMRGALNAEEVIRSFGSTVWPLIAKEATRVAVRKAIRGQR